MNITTLIYRPEKTMCSKEIFSDNLLHTFLLHFLSSGILTNWVVCPEIYRCFCQSKGISSWTIYITTYNHILFLWMTERLLQILLFYVTLLFPLKTLLFPSMAKLFGHKISLSPKLFRGQNFFGHKISLGQ